MRLAWTVGGGERTTGRPLRTKCVIESYRLLRRACVSPWFFLASVNCTNQILFLERVKMWIRYCRRIPLLALSIHSSCIFISKGLLGMPSTSGKHCGIPSSCCQAFVKGNTLPVDPIEVKMDCRGSFVPAPTFLPFAQSLILRGIPTLPFVPPS